MCWHPTFIVYFSWFCVFLFCTRFYQVWPFFYYYFFFIIIIFFYFFFRLTNFKFRLSVLRLLCVYECFFSLVSMGTVIIFTMLYSKVAHHFTLIQYECVLYNICINHKNVLIDLLWNKNKTSHGVRCEQSFLFCNGLFFFSVLVGSQALSERQNASLHQLFRKIMRYSVTVHEDIERNQFFFVVNYSNHFFAFSLFQSFFSSLQRMYVNVWQFAKKNAKLSLCQK